MRRTKLFFTVLRSAVLTNQKLVIFLTLTVLFNLSLILYRNLHLTGYWWGIQHYSELFAGKQGPSFLFLVWNLFLAWVPYGLTLLIRTEQPKWMQYGLLGGWLLFFPNAPYIITDLLHLRERLPVPLWYDMLTLFSFAWTGLIFGYLSLLRIQELFFKQVGTVASHLLTAAVWVLAGVGIYIGRFLRWNSWDILLRPLAFLKDISTIFTDPLLHWPGIGVAILSSALLFLGFSTIRAMR